MTNDLDTDVGRRVARIHARVLAFVLGAVFGIGLFVLTAWLVVKGGPTPGAHLQLLQNYFIGYSVTWVGSLVGLCYGFLVGALIGWAIGTIYNLVVDV